MEGPGVFMRSFYEDVCKLVIILGECLERLRRLQKWNLINNLRYKGDEIYRGIFWKDIWVMFVRLIIERF